MDRILILEDQPEMRTIYDDVLGSQYQVQVFSSLSEFKEYLVTPDVREPSLLLADLHLSDGTLLDLIRDDLWFPRFSAWPTIIVSAADDFPTIEACYSMGVVDYLTKPFNHNELVVKCRRVIETGPSRQFKYSPVTMTVLVNGRASKRLTSQESKLFHFLAASGKAGVTKHRLMEEVWGEPTPTKKLDVHISRLRKKLSDVNLSIECEQPYRLFLRAAGEGSQR